MADTIIDAWSIVLSLIFDFFSNTQIVKEQKHDRFKKNTRQQQVFWWR